VTRLARIAAAVASAAIALTGCDALPGRPTPEERPVVPTAVKDFATLWGKNCAGCHGATGELGAGTRLASAVYLAMASDDAIRRAIADGVPGTAMPAFAISQGGTLTDEQIGILVADMRKRWSDAAKLAGATPPPYAGVGGDATRGAAAYATYCASCHGADGKGGPRGGSVVDQGLRTAVIAGRPDLGMPDWRGYVAGRAMSPEEVSDVVAWLRAQRVQFPGPGRAEG
jgi:cytochrome c oxidase cbb3-type subunit 3